MNTVTDDQIDLIKRLKAERQPDTDSVIRYHNLRKYYTEDRATDLRAEQLIKTMMDLPMRNRARNLRAGIYETAVGLVRVYHGQNSGRMLAKLILKSDEHVRFMYLGLAQRHVSADARRLLADEVGSAALAMDSTVCLVCGLRLDNPESVQRGIGPVCIKNYGSI